MIYFQYFKLCLLDYSSWIDEQPLSDMVNIQYITHSLCVWQHWMQPWSSSSSTSCPAPGRRRWKKKVPAARMTTKTRRKSRKKMPAARRRRWRQNPAHALHSHNLQVKNQKMLKTSCFLSAGGSGAVPRGAGELSAAAVQVHGGQRWAQDAHKTDVYRVFLLTFFILKVQCSCVYDFHN